jgi:hypothetical protein
LFKRKTYIKLQADLPPLSRELQGEGEQRDPFLAKDGVTAGQAATIVLDLPGQTGVVVLSNAFPVNLGPPPGGGVGAADLARHLIRPAMPLG